MIRQAIIVAALALLPVHAGQAGVISAMGYADDAAFSADSGATSLTGPLPELGAVGTSVTLGDAKLSADNTIFVGTGWSTILPNGRAVAISGKENLDVSVETGRSSAFGFYFHEPAGSTAKEDGCNASCVDSVFAIEFLLGGSPVDSLSFSPTDNALIFMGIIFDTVFDEVRFRETFGGIDNEFFGEMFVTREVPTPGTLSLFAVSLAGLIALRRRRRSV